MDQNLSDKQSADKLAQHFASISQTFTPLDIESLPRKVCQAIKEGKVSDQKPILSEYKVYEKLRKAKKPHSSVKGDIPRKLLIEFTPEFTGPATKIYNLITKTTQYLNQWKLEYQVPIPKVSTPQTEDQIRNISKLVS